MPRLFLCDPSLMGFSGHCYSYLSSLIPSANARGYQTVLVGHHVSDPRMVNECGMFPLFRNWCDARYGSPQETRRKHEAELREELKKLDEAYPLAADDVLLINTLRHWAIRGVVDWLETVPEVRRPRVVLILHFTAFPDPLHVDETVDLYREAFDRIAASPVKRRIGLFADAEELVAEYQAASPRLDFRVAPIPHTHTGGVRPIGERIRVGYVGEARTNKGFDLLPHLVRTVVGDPALADVDFHIHTFIGNPRAEFYRKAMASLRHPRVVAYPDVMNEAEYGEFFASLDVVLIPYTPENYHSQTSGVLAEAMSYGKLTVVPKGTWMSRQVSKYGGGLAFNPQDGEDFTTVTCRLLSDARAMQHDAASRAAVWNDFHNPGRFLDLVLA